MDRPKVTVYVRLGTGADGGNLAEERTLTFNFPEGISQSDLLSHGFAIDGSQAMSGVTAYVDEDTGGRIPLAEALRDEQVRIVSWLNAEGYDVEFA